MAFRRYGKKSVRPDPRKARAAKKRIFRRKKAFNPPPRTLAVLGHGFPRQLKCVHKYHQTAQLTSVAGSTALQLNRCNGMFDPDHTGTGHQPMYYDQLTSLYNHWTVIGAKIVYRFSHTSTSNLLSQVVCFINDDTTTTPTSDALIEQTGAKSVVVPAGSNNRFTLSMGWSGKKTFGKPFAIGTSDYRGSATADPTEQSFFEIAMFQPGGSSQSLDVEITIEYIAIWTELKDIAGS